VSERVAWIVECVRCDDIRLTDCLAELRWFDGWKHFAEGWWCGYCVPLRSVETLTLGEEPSVIYNLPPHGWPW
jgi:hypothetical protein